MTKIVRAAALAAVLAFASASAPAQEHWTDGPVWSCSYYYVASENWDNYMLYLRRHTLPLQTARKNSGLALDYKTYIKQPSSTHDWNFAGCTLYKNYGAAMDFDAAAEAKGKEIASAHWKTQDEAAQEKAAAERYSLRTFLGSQTMRQINFRPLQ